MTNVVDLLDTLEHKIGKEQFKNIFKSITFDNGTEFRDFKGMEKSLTGDDSRTKSIMLILIAPGKEVQMKMVIK